MPVMLNNIGDIMEIQQLVYEITGTADPTTHWKYGTQMEHYVTTNG